MNVININGCRYGCDCESCSGWLLAPDQRAVLAWADALDQEAIGTCVSSMGRSGGKGGEGGSISRFHSVPTK